MISKSDLRDAINLVLEKEKYCSVPENTVNFSMDLLETLKKMDLIVDGTEVVRLLSMIKSEGESIKDEFYPAYAAYRLVFMLFNSKFDLGLEWDEE